MNERKLSGRLDDAAALQREKTSGHWTDEQLIAHLYGVGPEDGHLSACAECRSRLSAMETRREQVAAGAEEVPSEYLIAQRRRIYAALSERGNVWSRWNLRRWAPASAAALALAASLFFYGEQRRAQEHQNAISDAQLAQEVSQLAQGSEAPQTAPLEGLFVE
ncbi:MAG TPA: hypothetical protein VKX25_11220 [Bryobacteraceae bacterium]|jgi:hypothetical protein|nr:hypothetical protein [Bryobacteraceae bacterium]